MRTQFLCSLAGGVLLLGTSALAQTTTAPSTPPAKAPGAATTTTDVPKTTADAAKMTLTAQQAKAWVDKPVYSSDGKQIGEIVEFKLGPDNVVQELHADIGGFLGMGETRVKLTPQQFKLQDDRVVLNMTQDQAKNLPKVQS